MDGTGKLPSNRMLDAFKDEDELKKIYDEILPFAIAHKPWIKQFWDCADNTKSGFMTNGVVIGQTWDGPAISLKKAGKPISYQAPKEGAIGWVDGFSLVKGAKNIDQAYEWLKYIAHARGLGQGGGKFRLQSVRDRRRQAAVRQGARRSSTKPIPASRSTTCGGARSSRPGSPNCARNMRRSSRRRETLRSGRPYARRSG